MMNHSTLLPLVLVAFASGSYAATLDFEDVPAGSEYAYSDYVSQGYHMKSSRFYPDQSLHFYGPRLKVNLGDLNSGTNFMTLNFANPSYVTGMAVVHSAGAPFDLNGLELGKLYGYDSGIEVKLVGLDELGNVIDTQVFSVTSGLSTVSLTSDFTGMTTLLINGEHQNSLGYTVARFAVDNINVSESVTAQMLTCTGFDAPIGKGSTVQVKKNKALPFKAHLSDESGNTLTDADIAAPIVQVVFSTDIGGEEPIDVSDNALASGQGTAGNQFEYNIDDQKWHFNLLTKNYSAAGFYHVSLQSSDTDSYQFETPCEATFMIK